MAGEHHDDLVVQSLLLDEIGQSVIGMDDELRITYWKAAGSHVVLLREGVINGFTSSCLFRGIHPKNR